VRLNSGSSYASLPAETYDLFLTAAQCDGVTLWDLRSDRCIRRFTEHVGRANPVGLDFSPCGRFIATGSEDKAAYLYDVRAGRYLEKLGGHTDVVTDVQFHPLHPQLLTAAMDGKIRVFADAAKGGTRRSVVRS